MSKNKILFVCLIVVFSVGISSAEIHTNTKNVVLGEFEKIYELFMKISLPKSLDNQYNNSVPEKMSSQYLFRMFGLGTNFEAISVNLQNGDIVNATVSYNNFAKEYKIFANDVPEWKNYFDIISVNRLGKDIKTGNSKRISEDMANIGKSCSVCHENVQPQVWSKYYWKDFDTVNVSGPNGTNITWVEGMFALAAGFDGVGIYAQQSNQTGAQNSFSLFKAMMLNFKDACSNCHDSPRYYFVSDNEFSKIDDIGTNISNGNLNQANILQQQFGDNCYKCHVIHMPAQDMKAKMRK